MSERANHFKIGIFVLIGLVLFVVALFAVGIGAFFAKGDLFETYIDEGVENLSVGAVVKLRGVTIGKVTSISFIRKEQPQYNEQSVAVVFEVPREAGLFPTTNNLQDLLDKEIARGLRVRIETQGFIGPGIVMLDYLDPNAYPVTPLPWTPKYYYIPSAPSQFTHIFAAVEKTLSKVQNLDFNELMARTQTLIDTAQKLVSHIDRIDFGELGTNANSLVVEVRETNRGLQRTLADARQAIKDADVSTISREAQTLEARLTDAAVELRRLLASVDTGELNASLANVRSATEELSVLLHNLQQRPSAVLFSKPPKPDGLVEEPPKK